MRSMTGELEQSVMVGRVRQDGMASLRNCLTCFRLSSTVLLGFCTNNRESLHLHKSPLHYTRVLAC